MSASQVNGGTKKFEQLLLDLLHSRSGHFLTESGRHSDVWFDTKWLFLDSELLKPIVTEFGRKLAVHSFDIICGPADGGARIAQMISDGLGIECVVSEREVSRDNTSYTPIVTYSIPLNAHDVIKGKKIAIVDDIINAGVAAKATYHELVKLGAIPVVLGALLIKGDLIYPFIEDRNLSIEMISKCNNNMWLPEDCPLCVSKQPIESVVYV
jgi:orotate phosphoribosyltransferase